MIDTLKSVETLVTRGGIAPKEARAFAHAFAEATREDLATKEDLRVLRAELRAEMQSLRAELHGDMDNLRAELRGDMQSLRVELKADVAVLRADTEKIHFRTIAAVAVMFLINLAGTYGIVWSVLRNVK